MSVKLKLLAHSLTRYMFVYSIFLALVYPVYSVGVAPMSYMTSREYFACSIILFFLMLIMAKISNIGDISINKYVDSICAIMIFTPISLFFFLFIGALFNFVKMNGVFIAKFGLISISASFILYTLAILFVPIPPKKT